ncbi:histone lysine N-methyltransferase trithorax [Haematobia irritans]|uniref:histone lysine N-methyltransferase trithorax n=1 Tax=Haematobia irritans TaxID=7368 RepID=UPI003F4F7A33
MGRSKFPGKPSKSINRKRISVLQLDPNEHNSAGSTGHITTGPGPGGGGGSPLTVAPTSISSIATGAVSASSNASSSSSSSPTETAAATAHDSNSEDEEKSQTKSEEENNEEDQDESTVRAYDKYKNGKREEDDDDDDQRGNGNHKLANTNGQSEGSSIGGGHRQNGNRRSSSSSSQQQQQQQQNANAHQSKSLQNSKIPVPSLSAKVIASASNNTTSSTTTTTTSNPAKQTKKSNIQKLQEDSSKETANKEQETKEAKETAKKSNTPTAIATASSLSPSTSSSSSLPSLSSPNSTSTATVKFPPRNCKKFKNLNINKPEVMLPSSSKLKFQQQQKSITPTTAACSTTIAFNSKESAEPVQRLQQQPQQHSQKCEMSSSSTIPTTIPTTQTPTSAPATTTSVASTTTSSSSSRFNNNRLQQNAHHLDNNDDLSAVPKTRNNEDIDDDKNEHVRNPNHQHQNVGANNNDNNEVDHHVSKSSSQSPVQQHTANDRENHHHRHENDGKGEVAAVNVDGNSSSHNELKTTQTNSQQDSKPATESSIELNSDDRQKEECEESLKSSTSSSSSATTSSASATTPPSVSAVISIDMATTSSNGSSASTNNTSSTSNGDKKQKKTVTFKNVLETSDDKSAVKKFYNPDNRKPLISIIKKECLNRPLMYTRSSECIVRPSRLTEILKNNSNIDKLNSLKFRSNTNGGVTTTNGSERNSSSVLAGPLSRVFGAPREDEAEDQQNNISFRLTKNTSDEAAAAEEAEEDENNEDDENEDQEEEEDEDGGLDNPEEDDDEEEGEEQEEDETNKIFARRNTDSWTGSTTRDNVEKSQGEEKESKKPSEDESSNVIKSTLDRNEEEHQVVLDTHFVLPKRSSRSSRLIKPNKRLVEDSILTKKTSTKTGHGNASNSSPSLLKSNTSLQSNYFGLGDYNGQDMNGLTVSKSSKDSTATEAAIKPSAFAAATSTAFTNFGGNPLLSSAKPGSFILRQPRLQFGSLSTAASKSGNSNATSTNNSSTNSTAVTAAAAAALSASLPKSLLQAISSSSASASSSNNSTVNSSNSSLTASMLGNTSATSSSVNGPPTYSLNGTSSLKTNVNTSSSSLSPSSILCVVCSSPIHTKNLPQASKYGQLSCEYCRKFISKIAKKSLAIKNSATNKPIIPQCKGDGNCIILPLNKGIHIKNFKKLYKERCGLCWLKKCLNTLQLPKVRLNALIPVLNAVANNISSSSISSSNTTSSTITPNNNNNKLNTIESKLNKDLDNGVETNKLSIKWKPLATRETTSPITVASSVIASSLLTGSTAANMAMMDGLKIKTNPLSETMGTVVAFGASPLLRPAILEKSITALGKPMMAIETKQELVEKLDKKPLDILKEVKLELATEQLSPVSTASSSGSLNSSNTNKPNKRKDKASEKDRKEVKVKEMHSPKSEEKVRETKDPVDKAEQMENTDGQESNTNGLVATLNTTSITTAASTPAAAADKRQRIDLKGPRVKHVCRSASIVLGQPLAMFGEDEVAALGEGDLQQNGDIKLPLTDENDNCASCKTQQQTSIPQTPAISEENTCEQPPLKIPKVEASSTPTTTTAATTTTSNTTTTRSSLMTTSKLSQRPHHYNTQLTAYKKQFSSQMVASASSALVPQRRKEPQAKCKLLISIDFWENYDPAEVCQTGFGLIITETVAQRALCFLCGSAGQEPLIFCACCCEPYHQYCVQDEFNLKHGSLDETLLLNDSCLSITGGGVGTNTAIAKLNWLCPRCTVCYTCNMSSGAKVRCQKCQKNYHSTCLGTSKRLLGADRPLICVNCLKCRSCSTTKVTKFVGNLPMCTNCFKLRKKGNYCPVCQKCYDDQDFDLKMMECGDCHQWVHAKCETLTDEQYNLLSTLPESIEFICKRCSRKSTEAKERACEWREAVKEEFQSNLMSVLKLLSKSRQACSLLRLSPRKQMKCSCGGNGGLTSAGTITKYQPKALLFNQEQSTQNGSSQSIDVYEFDDHEKDHTPDLINSQPLAMEKKCICQTNKNNPANGGSSNSNAQLSLVEIKQKIANHSYGSLAEFHYDMSMVIQQANCDELVIVYKELLSEQFPWFQNETQACTDALEEDMYESAGGAYGLNSSLDTESDYQMDCLPTANDHHEEAQRSALLAELPHDLEDQLYGVKNRTDTRICLFCRRSSEGLPNEEARLLYCGHDCWVHTNCALWSAEVFEEIDGSLQNVHSAVSRGRMIKCSVCGNRGATVGCNVKSCGEHYHYPCARSKNCAFLADKSMYCPTHAPSANNAKVPFETQFEVLRPVYVELERKRKKLVEPSKVQFHIGSLEVKQLGHILPRFSDTYEALVPVNFQCSRLYWSSKEPWKIVEYNVRTYIHNSSNSTLGAGCMDMGKNFTVDHSQGNAAMISVGLSQIQQWHMSLARGDYEGAMEDYDYLNNFPQPCVASSGGHHESSTANDEEPQTNADLLPPEIKEAIFEDLPGDLLEGISMLDIFTKCMNYEDMAQGEQTPLTDEDTMTSIGAFTKQLTAELNNGWPNAAEDALFSTSQAVKLQKLKKSSSPVISCDAVTAKNAIKRRKISENMLISFNHRSQKKECSAATAATRRLDLDNSTKRTFTWSAEKRYNVEGSVAATTNSSSAAAMQQSDSKIRIMQVDGVDDSITEYRFITQDAAAATAVKCERCQCTYRNIESFQRHIPNCEAMSSSTSESESDHTSHAQSEIHTNGGITLEQLQELNNKLQQQQQQQQRTTQLPFLQAIPTQTLSQLQGLQTLPMQLQNVQNLQNLQNLQQLQQLTQPQTLGGNFFISAAPAAPEVTATTPDLQLYANALQGLTANLANGTFTLQPTANTAFNTAAAAHPQVAANQPQLLALSTNADGTQQIIQLPAQQNTAAPTATYQTLHATNSDKKIILPVGGGKPMKTMATKAAQQAAAKNKLKATTAVKPIQSKINVATTATTTHHQIPVQQQQQTVNATQLLNQQILQQLQQQAAAAQQQQASNAGPQIVFQQSTPSANTATQQAGPQIIMQQAQPQNIISFVTTTNDASGQPQFQYVTLPTNGGQAAHEYKPQASTLFATTTNAAPTHHHHHQPLMQSAYLQTDASGNLVLTNAPQTATPLQLLTAPTQSPQVIGTLIQPQTLQLQGGNVLTTSSADGSLPQSGATQTQQQVIISGPGGSGPTGLEMLTTANGTPQVILATNTPPMYYGLETIVQNTVMSSQQFVSTAMPGVLSQNASFSATTTQVFQASKIEPLVDIPAGYVLLNNVDPNNASILQPQQQQAAAAAAATASQAQAQVNQASFIQAALQQQAAAAAAASLAAEQQQHQQQQQTNVYRIQTPPVSTAQSFQLQPQIVVATPTPSTPAPQPPMAAQHLSTSGTTTQYVDPNTGTVYSAKVTPVAQVKRTKTAAATPVATVTKVQPQVVNKVMPNVAQITVQQQQQAQATVAAAVVAQQQKLKQTASHQAKGSSSAVGGGHLNLQQSPSAATAAEGLKPHQQEITVTHQQPPPQQTAAPVPSTKKTNMIRPLNKAEVKPKVMKTAAATVVTKPATTHGNNTNMGAYHHQMTSNPNKMIILKPQQQQTTQQVLQQQAQRIPESTLDARLTHATSNEAMPQHNNLASLNSLSDNSMNNEYLTVQHVANNNSNNNQHQHVAANNHHQHYNVADALLLDESSSMAQQQLSHCSYSVGGSVVATANSCFESNSQQSTTTTSTSSNDSVSNILPTIQRMPQYTNINIVNPLQQYSSSAANTTSSSSSTTTAISSATTVVTRPTNRVLPMQQKTTYDCGSTSNSTTTTYNHPASNHYTMAFGAVSSMTSSSATSTMTTTSLNSQMTSHQENNNAITGNVHGEESAPLLKGENTITKIAYEAEVKQMLLHSPNPQQQQLQQDSVAASQQCQLQQQQQQRVMFMHHQQNQQLQSPTTLPKASPPHLAYDLNEKPAEMDSSKLCYVQNPNAQMQNYVEESAVATTPIAAGEECLIGDPKFPPEGEVLLGSDCCENEDEAALAEDNDPPGEDDDEEDDGFSLKMPSTNCSDNLSMDSDEPAVKEKISKILDNLTNEDCNDSLNTNTTAEAVQHEVNCANVNNTVMDTGMDYLQTPQTSQTQATPTVEQQIVAGETGEFYAASPEETSALIADVELAVENIKEKLQEKLQPQIVDPLATEYHMENCQSNQEDLMQEHQQEQHHQEHHNAGELTMSTTNPPPQPPTRLPKRLSGPHLLYEIQSEDGFTYKSTSIAEVWEKVFEAVQVARSANGLAPLPEGPLADMSGVQMIGLKTNALKYLIEQLPGVEKCTKYTPKYHKRSGASTPLSHGGNSNSSSCSQGSTIGGAPTTLDADGNSMDYASDQEELNENPFDCARCEPYSKRSEYDMFSWLASRHRKQPVQVFVQPSDNELVPRRGTGSNLPMAMKYRTLKETYKDYVGVFRSHIHGRGLYCTKDIEAGEMVIEYAGELIRSTLTDQRERYYNSRGIGCYMFKIDDNLVVDATMRGNAARFINHSCEPNCYSKVVDILGHKHIIIFALRRIVQGEELTYDYKFPFEDEKIPCSCGSKRCRKYLN